VVLTTLNAAMQRLPSRETVADAALSVTVGRRWTKGACAPGWPDGLYPHPDRDRGRRFCPARRDHRHLPPGRAEPVRLDLFGDVLDGLRSFDPASQRTTGKMDRRIWPRPPR
jgi:transcription-repair coupling factor (superfamily II helicase)